MASLGWILAGADALLFGEWNLVGEYLSNMMRENRFLGEKNLPKFVERNCESAVKNNKILVLSLDMSLI